MIRAGLILSLLPLAASAQQPLTAEAFEARVLGKTLYFLLDDGEFGAEQYLPNRRVRWQFPDGTCEEGRWYPEGNALCFLYETDIHPHCWVVHDRAGELVAYLADQPEDGPIRADRMDEKPLDCPGPDLGV